MRLREFYSTQSDELSLLWKTQMLFGVLLVLGGVLVVLFPAILVALMAACVMMAGIGFIGAAWRMRRLEDGYRGVSVVETLEW